MFFVAAKNVALAGVKALTLHDTRSVSWLDLSTNFYCSPADIGQNRALVSAREVKELNPYTRVSTSTDDLQSGDLTFLDEYKCVVLTDASLVTQIRVNEYCRSRNINFLSCDVRGVFCWAFADFGNQFEVFDKDGEELKEVLIGNVSNVSEINVCLCVFFFFYYSSGKNHCVLSLLFFFSRLLLLLQLWIVVFINWKMAIWFHFVKLREWNN